LIPSHRPSAQITSPTPDMTKPNLIPRKEIANAFYGLAISGCLKKTLHACSKSRYKFEH
jgi:hypothetical protein